MHRYPGLIAAAAGMLLGAPAAAQSTDADRPTLTQRSIAPTLSQRETRFRFIDGDAFISRDEVAEDASILRSQFPSLDANGDGKLSTQEYVLSHRTHIE